MEKTLQENIDKIKDARTKEFHWRSKFEMMYKYSEYFEFFQSKPIDQILQKIMSKAYTDYLEIYYLDDQKERLKRYYNKKEIKLRLKNYSSYYSKLDDYHIPNTEIHPQRKMMFKNQKRKYKLQKRKERFKKNKRKTVIQNQKNEVLQNLSDQTIYLNNLPATKNHPQISENWQGKNFAFQIDYKHKKGFDEEHDIYNPCNSDDEKQYTTIEKVRLNNYINIEGGNFKAFEGRNLSESSNSIKTVISDFEMIEESRIQKKNHKHTQQLCNNSFSIIQIAENLGQATVKPKQIITSQEFGSTTLHKRKNFTSISNHHQDEFSSSIHKTKLSNQMNKIPNIKKNVRKQVFKKQLANKGSSRDFKKIKNVEVSQDKRQFKKKQLSKPKNNFTKKDNQKNTLKVKVIKRRNSDVNSINQNSTLKNSKIEERSQKKQFPSEAHVNHKESTNSIYNNQISKNSIEYEYVHHKKSQSIKIDQVRHKNLIDKQKTLNLNKLSTNNSSNNNTKLTNFSKGKIHAQTQRSLKNPESNKQNHNQLSDRNIGLKTIKAVELRPKKKKKKNKNKPTKSGYMMNDNQELEHNLFKTLSNYRQKFKTQKEFKEDMNEYNYQIEPRQLKSSLKRNEIDFNNFFDASKNNQKLIIFINYYRNIQRSVFHHCIHQNIILVFYIFQYQCFLKSFFCNYYNPNFIICIQFQYICFISLFIYFSFNIFIKSSLDQVSSTFVLTYLQYQNSKKDLIL